jgi:hypothetical protein
MEKLKAIVWTTGKVGKHALRAVLDDPRMELVGVYAHSADKAGQDGAVLVGRPACGIAATNDIDALIATGADTVFYTPFEANADHAERLLAAGLDVISTNLFMNLGGMQGDLKARMEAACAKGGSSLYITGINPGWVNSMVTAMTAICRGVDSVELTESADCSVYESVETWSFLGMGEMGGVTPELKQRAFDWMIMFRDVTRRIGDALELEFDDLEFVCEYATAAEDIDLGWFKMAKGSNAALKASWNGKIGGVTRVTVTLVWYLTDKLTESWPLDKDQYHIVVKGDPDVDARFRFTPPARGWANHDWDIMTALPAVSAAFDVKSARPGVLGLRDVGLPYAPMGAWLKAAV